MTVREKEAMKKRLGPAERIYPMPTAIVVSGTLAEPARCTVAWISVVSSTPPALVVGLRKNRDTLRAIERSRSFTVNLPSPDMVEVADYFGITTGRKVNKFAASGLTLRPGAVVSAPFIAECRYALECEVAHAIELGQYQVIVGEIMETWAAQDILDENGNVLIEKLDPLIYVPGAREYRRVGEKVADAYSIGKSLNEGD